MTNLLSIIIPVFNEAENFPPLWQAITAAIQVPFQAIVVYDFDADTTVPAVDRILSGGEQRLRLVKNNIRPGVVGAIRTGFQQVGEGPVLVLMADLSDDLAKIAPMLELYWSGYGIVAGSRYMPGGAVIGGPWLKKAMSRLAGVSLHWLRGLPTHDATNAFKIYDRAMLDGFSIESSAGFEINLEITVKAFLRGHRIAEVPATWRDRVHGSSRFRVWAWLPRYLRWYFHAFQPRSSLRPLVPRSRAETAVEAKQPANDLIATSDFVCGRLNTEVPRPK